MFSTEFKKALTQQVFENGGMNHFHDVVLQKRDKSLNEVELRALFNILPEELQILALQWGLNDTQFCDDVGRFLIHG